MSRPRPATRVGDVVSRREANGTVTFWRIDSIERDELGTVVMFTWVR
ncbi:hypothetical protein KNU62_gp11 [Gordonia phage Bakery]|uniref:Uncharacterized protein n=1 Tax=Gordonia phage Bakery TaxID=2591205 RepID=A0A514DGP8_9CAUD|nr:hypothetical protein KNU62_gp11 [Gordonia phage Bakery]QDH92796.1 hypothetical protein SEA_BAKERY_11 [Gordonia phage Bakery]